MGQASITRFYNHHKYDLSSLGEMQTGGMGGDKIFQKSCL